MENRVTIDWAAHEADMARMERINRRLWVALLVVIALFTITNEELMATLQAINPRLYDSVMRKF